MEVPLAPSGGVEVIGMSKRFGGKAVLPPLLAVGAGLVGNRVSAPTAAPKVSLDQSISALSQRKEGVPFGKKGDEVELPPPPPPEGTAWVEANSPKGSKVPLSTLGLRGTELPPEEAAPRGAESAVAPPVVCAITFASAILNAHASHNTLLAWMAYHGRPGSGACGSGQLKV
jgi:hypothetical protein